MDDGSCLYLTPGQKTAIRALGKGPSPFLSRRKLLKSSHSHGRQAPQRHEPRPLPKQNVAKPHPISLSEIPRQTARKNMLRVGSSHSMPLLWSAMVHCLQIGLLLLSILQKNAEKYKEGALREQIQNVE